MNILLIYNNGENSGYQLLKINYKLSEIIFRAMVGRLAVFLEFSEPRPKVNESGELLMTLLIPTMEGEELEDDERLKEFLSLVDKEVIINY